MFWISNYNQNKQFFMSDSIVKLQNNPYGQVSFETFRLEELAVADKSYIWNRGLIVE